MSARQPVEALDVVSSWFIRIAYGAEVCKKGTEVQIKEMSEQARKIEHEAIP